MPQLDSLQDYPLTRADAELLFGIAGAASYFLSHDVRSPVRAVRGFAELLVDKLGEARLNAQPEDVAELISIALLITKAANHADAFLAHAGFGGASLPSAVTPFIASVADAVARDLPDSSIAVSQGSPRTLRVLFPSAPLYSVVYELARNASTHGSAARVVLQWTIDLDNLLFSVHDEGERLNSLLSDRLLALELLAPGRFHNREGGLAIVRDVVRAAGGLLLARRSPLLGGAEIAFRVPLSAFSFEALPL